MGERYDQVSLDKRCEIYRLHEGSKSRRAIGRLLGRHSSTIGREPDFGATSVNYYFAQLLARGRRRDSDLADDESARVLLGPGLG